jgi:hypothetical protein
MCKGAGIKHDKVDAFMAGIVNTINQLILGIALQVQQLVSCCMTGVCQACVDIIQGFFAVDLWLAGAQQVQVRAMQDE